MAKGQLASLTHFSCRCEAGRIHAMDRRRRDNERADVRILSSDAVGDSPSRALRKAEIMVMRKNRTAEPYYWGAHVIAAVHCSVGTGPFT